MAISVSLDKVVTFFFISDPIHEIDIQCKELWTNCVRECTEGIS